MALETRKRYTLVDPTTQPLVAGFHSAPRLTDLRGKRLGLIDDSKMNGKELLEELAELLRTKYEATVGMYHRKPTASKPADPKAVREMARKCDYAIVAIGD